MTRGVTLRFLTARGRARRSILTALMVAAGVATISGTLVFTDTIHGAFRRLFVGGARGAQVIVSGTHDLNTDPSSGATVPDATVNLIAALPGVAAAQGQIDQLASIVGRDGQIVPAGRLPTQGLTYLNAPFDGIHLIAGAPPTTAGEVVIDAHTARTQRYAVGDAIPIVAGGPVRTFRISGIATLGPDSPGGETFAAFSLPTAQALYGETGTVDLVEIAVTPGFSPVRVAREVKPLLGPQLTVHTRRGQVDLEVARVSARLETLDTGLLAFALIAIVVGTLLIFNTFAITATQRTREVSLLRALGATRGQVLRSTLLEAALIGLAGAAIGIVLGPLAAIAIRAVLDAAGLGLPAGGLIVSVRALLIGAGTGLAAALIAAVIPSLRSTRAAPLEALRASAAPPRGRRRTVIRAVLAAALGIAGLATILAASGPAADRLRTSAIGGAIVIVATLIAGPITVRLLAGALARPIVRRGDAIAQLAREQVVRSPSRTAVSASALTIGLALVLLVTAYAGGLRAAANGAVRATFTGDLAIESEDGTSAMPAATVQAAASLPGLVGIAGVRTAEADAGRAGAVEVNGIEPTTWASVYRFQWVDGSAAALAGLGVGDALVEADTARAAHLRVGGRIILATGSGQRVAVTVAGIYRDAGLLRGITLDQSWFAQLFHQPRLRAVFVKLAPGTNVALARGELQSDLRDFPGVVARSEPELAARTESDVASVTGLLYALLALSLVMSLIGIVGTLNLSVHERTRELGMLRAVGMTADQARALIRDESLISAAIGSLTGVVLGLVLGWAVVHALAAQGFVFTVPWTALVAALAAGGLAGTLAALPPGRRAARLDLLTAIAYE